MIQKAQYKLTKQNISNCVEETDAVLSRYKFEKGDKFHLLLLLEEMLVNLTYKVSETNSEFFKCIIQKKLNNITVTVLLHGDMQNPFEADARAEENEDEDEFSQISISRSILSNIDCATFYQYENGCNQMQFILKTKQQNPTLWIIGAIAAAILCAFGGGALLSPAQTTGLLTATDVIRNTLTNLLNAVVKPFVFFSILDGVVNIGNIHSVKQLSKKLIRNIVIFDIFAAVLAFLTGLVFYPQAQTAQPVGGGNMSDIMALLTGIIPSSLIEPFVTGNSLQIAFLGLFVGLLLLVGKEKLPKLLCIVDELSTLVRSMLSAVCTLLPVLIFVLLFNFLLQKPNLPLGNTIEVVFITVGVTIFAFMLELVVFALWNKISLLPYLKKVAPVLMIAFTTTSSSATYMQHYTCCTETYKIDPRIVKFAIPVGSILCVNGLIIHYYLPTLFAAKTFSVSLSLPTLILLVLMCFVFAVATPPVAGSGMFIYSLIFASFGIPSQAVALAMIMNLIFDFFSTTLSVLSLNISILQSTGALKPKKEKSL